MRPRTRAAMPRKPWPRCSVNGWYSYATVKGPKFDRVKDEDAIKGRGGLAKAVTLAGPFIMSSQGKP
jgi:hypothetical protein